MQALERRQSSRRARVEAQGGLVELDRRIDLAAASLEETGALHDQRRALPRVLADGIRLSLVGSRERGPRLRGDLGLLHRLEKRGVRAIELESGLVCGLRLLSIPDHVLEEPALLVEERRLAPRIGGQPGFGVEEWSRGLIALARHQHAAGTPNRGDVLRGAIQRLLVVRGGAAEVTKRMLVETCDLEVKTRGANRCRVLAELRLARGDELSRVLGEGVALPFALRARLRRRRARRVCAGWCRHPRRRQRSLATSGRRRLAHPARGVGRGRRSAALLRRRRGSREWTRGGRRGGRRGRALARGPNHLFFELVQEPVHRRLAGAAAAGLGRRGWRGRLALRERRRRT